MQFNKMSIQINLDGLSFCIFNKQDNCVESIYNFNVQTTDEDIKSLEEGIFRFIKNESDLRQEFDNIMVIYNSLEFSVLPKEFFVQDNLKSYMYPMVENLDKRPFYEQIDNELINVYIPNRNVLGILEKEYGKVEQIHFFTLLFNLLKKYSQNKKDVFFVIFNRNKFDLIGFSDGKYVLYNRFDVVSDVDIVYYIAFALNQLNVDINKAQVNVLGDIREESERFKFMCKHVKNLNLFNLNYEKKYNKHMDTELIEQHFLVTNSFAYENNFREKQG